MNTCLTETGMLNYSHPKLQKLIGEKGWLLLPEKARITAIYNYVRDEIRFGYNADDTITAAQVLDDGFGQCNTKGTLFMALLRATGTPCRIHGFTIDKRLQKGAQTGIVYLLAPGEIVHSWVEVFYNNQWWNTEGLILDTDYLHAIQGRFSDCTGGFCGYGIADDNLQHPVVDWNENHTYIQSSGIVQDFGVFNSPDEFFAAHSQTLSPVKRWMYRSVGRKLMNRNVAKLRDSFIKVKQ